VGVISAVQLDEGSEDVGDLWNDDVLSEGNDWADTDEALEPEGEVVDPEEPDDASGDDDSDDEG
jgi:hypothetical protein